MIRRIAVGLALLAGPLACGDTPLEPAGDVAWVAVAAGAYHSCGLTTEGAAYCWGSNEAGQVGVGSSERVVERPSLVAADARFVALSAGWRHTCAVDDARRAWCWGEGSSGQLGDAGSDRSRTPRRVPGLADVSSVAAGGDHTCAVAGGRVFCWGSNDRGQLGSPGAPSGSGATEARVPGLVTAVGAGASHACALTAEGSVFCWGANGRGQLGSATPGDAPAPVSVSPRPRPFASVSAGGDHACARTDDGRGWCWGDNTRGELDPRGPVTVGVPSEVPLAAPLRALDAGPGGLTCALQGAGAWTCWGLVRARGADVLLAPTTLGVSGEAVSVAAGASHACAVTAGGALACWGAGDAGQLGSGRVDFLESPTPVG